MFKLILTAGGAVFCLYSLNQMGFVSQEMVALPDARTSAHAAEVTLQEEARVAEATVHTRFTDRISAKRQQQALLK